MAWKIFGGIEPDQTQAQIKSLTDQIAGEVSQRVRDKLVDEFTALSEVEGATQKVIELQTQIATLNATKAQIEESYARKEREIEHRVGLLRQEVEAEKKQREDEFTLRVREANLSARETGLVERQKAFDERMDFMTKWFTEEVGYLKELLEKMSERLPDATILATVSKVG